MASDEQMQQMEDEGDYQQQEQQEQHGDEAMVEGEEAMDAMADGDHVYDEGTGGEGDGEEAQKEEEEEEKDAKKEEPKKKKIIERFLIPTFTEFKDDVSMEQKARSLAIGPLCMEDFADPILNEAMEAAEHFKVTFDRVLPEQPKKEEGDEEVEVSTDVLPILQGYVTIQYENEEEAAMWQNKLQDLREGLICKHLIPIDNKTVSLSDIRGQPVTKSGKSIPDWDQNIRRVIVVTSLPKEVTEADIREKIPSAKSVLIPRSFCNSQRKGYAYVELPTKEEVNRLVRSKIYFGDVFCKLLIPQTMPTFNAFMQNFMREKPFLCAPGPVDSISYRERLTELVHQGTHYQRVDYLKDHQIAPLNKAMDLLLRKLKRDDRRGDKRAFNDNFSSNMNKRGRFGNDGGNFGNMGMGNNMGSMGMNNMGGMGMNNMGGMGMNNMSGMGNMGNNMGNNMGMNNMGGMGMNNNMGMGNMGNNMGMGGSMGNSMGMGGNMSGMGNMGMGGNSGGGYGSGNNYRSNYGNRRSQSNNSSMQSYNQRQQRYGRY